MNQNIIVYKNKNPETTKKKYQAKIYDEINIKIRNSIDGLVIKLEQFSLLKL